MLPGYVQVPPDGRPVVLLRDHGVTGGYPVIACVHPDDVWIVGQTPPGATCASAATARSSRTGPRSSSTRQVVTHRSHSVRALDHVPNVSRCWREHAMRTFLGIGAMLIATVVPAAAFQGAALASPPGNSGGAELCQRGGFTSYARADGSRFASTGACVSHAAEGGTLVPLPDLRVRAVCSDGAGGSLFGAGSVACYFTVTNVGPGTATGDLRIEGSFRIATSVLGGVSVSSGGFSSGGICAVGYQEFAEITDRSVSGAFVCANSTLAPGATLDAGMSLTGIVEPGVPITAEASVDDFDTIMESNEANNTFTRIFFA
jgi:hypothetical protein